ncbi:MAG: D-alanyl-D-alanine carboxypeptidase [Clostridia bacterium]|nr:D-alanyl-D-alanine carboxypeptidase [Clostridia bacterium]
MKWVFSVLLCLVLMFFLPFSASAEVGAKAAVLINGQTGEILYAKNCHEQLSMASTTKIMTALLLAENADLSKTITATRETVTVEGSSMGLLPGDTVSYRDLLYGMLLASGNDAANTAAISLCGSVEKFSALMNKKAADIGMKNTNFVTPSGLDSAGHYSTAYDMALLARHALENEDFAAAAASKYATLSYGNPPYRRTLKNHNKLLWNYDGCIGVKTGYTKKSGRCLVSSARRENGYLIAVTLSDPNDWATHKELLDYGFSLLENRTLPGEDFILPTAGGKALSVKSESVSVSLTDKEYASLEKRVFLPQFVYSAQKGECLGRVEYLIGENIVVSSAVRAIESTDISAEKSALGAIISDFKMLLKAMI